MKKGFAIKGFSFVLVLAMLLVGITIVPAAAETTTPTYAPDETWGADEDGVYRIYDAPDLLKFLSTVYHWEGDTYEGKTVMLMADIDLNPGWNASSKSKPTNAWNRGTFGTQFHGSFDGNGHTLRGIYVESDNYRLSLFGEFKGAVPAVFKNLRVENVYLKSIDNSANENSYHGVGLFYHTLNSQYSTLSFENVYVAEDVYIDATFGQIGGFVGRTWNYNAENPLTLNFRDCVFAGTINSTGMQDETVVETTSVGGFLGCDRAINKPTITYERCAFTGTIHAKGAAGGMTGKVGAPGHKMIECVYAGTIDSESEGATGAFAILDYHIYCGDNPFTSNIGWSTGNTKNVTLIDCYQIGNIDSFGYRMKDGQVVDVKTDVNELETRYSVTVQYGAEEAKTYQPVTSAENVTAIRSAVKKVESKKALLDMEQFAKWAISTDGKTLIPAGLARSMFAIRIAGFQTTTPENDAFSIRCVAVLDNLESYSKAGYEVEVTREADGKKAAETLETFTVYTGINTPEGVVTAEKLNGSYICGLSIKNIPTTGTYTLKIRAYLVGIDGETFYYSTSVNVRVVNGVASYI